MEIRATSLYRVIACNGYVALGGENLPSATGNTDDAQEGVAAHFIGAQVLSGRTSDPVEYVERQMPNGVFVSPDMAEFVSDYTDNILKTRPYGGPVDHLVEIVTDFTVAGTDVIIRGRADHICFDRIHNVLYIDDFKYGWRLREPEENWALIAHAIGICIRKGYSAETVCITIYQPRPYHQDGPIRTWTISRAELQGYQIQLATALGNLTDKLATGDHCRDCALLDVCPAARMAGMNAIEVSHKAFKDDMPDEALAFELDNLERAEDAIKLRKAAIEELAKHRIENGHTIARGNTASYMLDNSYGRRAWNAGVSPEYVQVLTGRVDLAHMKLVTPTQAIKAGVSEDVIKLMSDTPYRGTKLVRVNPNKRGKKLFGDKGK